MHLVNLQCGPGMPILLSSYRALYILQPLRGMSNEKPPEGLGVASHVLEDPVPPFLGLGLEEPELILRLAVIRALLKWTALPLPWLGGRLSRLDDSLVDC